MAAYVILDLHIFDKEQLAEYKSIASKIIDEFRGEIIVRGGKTKIVQGNCKPERMVIIKFDSYEIANNFWNSEAYQKAIALRKKGAETNAIIIDGV